MISLGALLLLALVQGMAELLPVSSSAHVIVAEKFLGLDPTSPPMTFLLVMLHTGTMFAVILYFWPIWKVRLCAPPVERLRWIRSLLIATAATGFLGLILKKLIEKAFLAEGGSIEDLFGNLRLIGGSLFAVGLLIFWAGGRREQNVGAISDKDAFSIGLVQGLCLPFRGFSRSGATISVALLRGWPRRLAEDFSFALAVILTPPVIAREALRLLKAHKAGLFPNQELHALFLPGLLGMVLSFASGCLALKLLSRVLETGRWRYFAYYCFLAAAFILMVRL